MAKVV
ncbi:hypothetical protein LINPERHAP1_LOCUS8348 [Linum perenne]